MNGSRPNGAGGRLGIMQLVTTSLRRLSLCRDDAIRLGAVPAALHIGAMLYGQPALSALLKAAEQGSADALPAAFGTLLLMAAVAIFSLALLAVNWLRFLLLGPQAAPGLGLGIGRPHVQFLLGVFALGFATIIGLTVISFPIGLIAGRVSELATAIAALGVGLVFFRVFLALIAIAIGQPIGLKQAWEASRGQGPTLLIAVLLAEVPFFLLTLVIGFIAGVTGLTAIAPYTLLLISSLIQVAATMAQCGVLAAAYRRLIGVRA
jgi:hypothetical protein